VLGKCFGYDSDIQAGMRWAAGLSVPGEPVNPSPARVLNLSLGGDGTCSASYASTVSQVLAAGAVIVAAAGNSNGLAVETPGNCAGVIAVAGIRHVGTKVGYSSLGPEVAIAAPAGNCVNTGPNDPCEYAISSTTNTGTQGPVAGDAGAAYTDAFNYSVGTSFSAPQVAATAALMLSANPSLTPADVKRLLQQNARPFPGTGGTAGITMCQAPTTSEQDECYCTTSTCGAGMLDAAHAVQAAGQIAAPVTGVQATVSVTPATPQVGQSVTLAASIDAGVPATYHWQVVAGNANLTGAVDAASTTLSAAGTGDVVVRLTLTDASGNVTTVDQPFRVAAAAPTSTPSNNNGNGTTSSSGGGGGGGGALSWPWLLALALAVALLAAPRRRAQI
jgi:serine protease